MESDLRNFSFLFKELELTIDLVEEAMGYGRGMSPEPFPELIANGLEKAGDLCDISGSLCISDSLSPDPSGFIVIGGVAFGVGKKIARQLRNAEGGALFICTAGPGIGERSKELMARGELIEGYILDVIGSLTVEAAIGKIQDIFELEMTAAGKKIANRYSPGYCGWALKEQRQFFRFFPENHCGIKLSDSCLMDPIKSVSGIIGFGAEIRKTVYECQMCELETCIYRAIRLAREN